MSFQIQNLFFKIKKEIYHASIMRDKAEREKNYGLPQCYYRPKEAAESYSIMVAENNAKLLQEENIDDTSKSICQNLYIAIKREDLNAASILIENLEVSLKKNNFI